VFDYSLLVAGSDVHATNNEVSDFPSGLVKRLSLLQRHIVLHFVVRDFQKRKQFLREKGFEQVLGHDKFLGNRNLSSFAVPHFIQ